MIAQITATSARFVFSRFRDLILSLFQHPLATRKPDFVRRFTGEMVAVVAVAKRALEKCALRGAIFPRVLVADPLDFFFAEVGKSKMFEIFRVKSITAAGGAWKSWKGEGC
jgi:hypothetical protein